MTYKLPAHIVSDDTAVDLRDDLISKYPLDVIPPIEPPVEPPIEPPTPSPTLHNMSFSDIWGVSLVAPDVRKVYQLKNIRVSKRAGVSIAIRVPHIEVGDTYELGFSSVAPTNTAGSRYAVLSDRRDFDNAFYTHKTWGTGPLRMILNNTMSADVIYLNIRLNTSQVPWDTKLQPFIRKL